jgi:hypothetical protein
MGIFINLDTLWNSDFVISIAYGIGLCPVCRRYSFHATVEGDIHIPLFLLVAPVTFRFSTPLMFQITNN